MITRLRKWIGRLLIGNRQPLPPELKERAIKLIAEHKFPDEKIIRATFTPEELRKFMNMTEQDAKEIQASQKEKKP